MDVVLFRSVSNLLPTSVYPVQPVTAPPWHWLWWAFSPSLLSIMPTTIQYLSTNPFTYLLYYLFSFNLPRCLVLLTTHKEKTTRQYLCRLVRYVRTRLYGKQLTTNTSSSRKTTSIGSISSLPINSVIVIEDGKTCISSCSPRHGNRVKLTSTASSLDLVELVVELTAGRVDHELFIPGTNKTTNTIDRASRSQWKWCDIPPEWYSGEEAFRMYTTSQQTVTIILLFVFCT